MSTFQCMGCGHEFEGLSTPEDLQAELEAFEDVPETPMELVCDDCWRDMRAHYPTLDARFKLKGL